ncbi:hypothetical protein [Streptomyces sp. 7-21]|uniref:hypothetical protein n=1 Tax=Streptomyces sp. 7-21 TaxID=2802283 RepID=UPI00191D0BDC|nr:hypothetical protein [Streptomyces sp. 7-21]MBL1065415.1 hypothetical protein [Streptomyces sp. 7-21]
MPIRRFRTALLATAAVTALAVTACGGGGSDGADDEIEGVDQGNSEQQDASASEEPQDDGVDRPEIVLPEDLELVFEGWESSDALEQEVLNDGRERLRAIFAAAAEERNPEAEPVLFYHAEGEGLENAIYWIEGFTEYDLTIEGTIRYVAPEVTIEGQTQALLTYCADERDARAVNLETGEPEPAPEQTDLFYTTNLEKDDRGVWMTTNVHTDRRDCSS